MIVNRDPYPAVAEVNEAASQSVLDLLNRIPIPCRVIARNGQVLWESKALRELLHSRAERGCCGSLGLRHTEQDCSSSRAFRSGNVQRQMVWLGRMHVAVESVPIHGFFGADVVCWEYFRDVTAERRLEAALARQQNLLETINRAMIKINHNLEIAQEELEQKNQSLEEANLKLRSLDRLKDEFISIVSHELKAPLTSIKGSVELIRTCESASMTPTGHELLAVCQRNVHRLHRLVQDLLDIARIESGRLTLGFSRFNAYEMVEECYASERTAADAKKVILDNRVPLDLLIEADRERMVQVMVNLMNNAVKFTDRGAVVVEARSEANGSATFEIRDTGIGIDKEEQARIFDKFAQVGGELHRNSGGTGLGLSIVRGIIREHGGDIQVVSEPGQGSRFIFSIPQPPGKGTRDSDSPLD